MYATLPLYAVPVFQHVGVHIACVLFPLWQSFTLCGCIKKTLKSLCGFAQERDMTTEEYFKAMLHDELLMAKFKEYCVCAFL